MKYSIIIPVHNEANNLYLFVSDFIRNVPSEVQHILLEIILVENGSTDSTLQVCEQLRQDYPDLIKVYTLQRGSYGEAIKHGILNSIGTHLSILECDVLDITFVHESINIFREDKADFIVASKLHPDSIDRRPLKRRLLTRAYNFLLGLFLKYPGTDTHGLKSIRTEIAKKLSELSITTDEIFQTEIVLLAWKQGYRLYELPLQIEETRTSPISVRARFPMVVNTIQSLRKSLNRSDLKT